MRKQWIKWRSSETSFNEDTWVMDCDRNNGNYQHNYGYSPYENSIPGTVDFIFIGCLKKLLKSYFRWNSSCNNMCISTISNKQNKIPAQKSSDDCLKNACMAIRDNSNQTPKSIW